MLTFCRGGAAAELGEDATFQELPDYVDVPEVSVKRPLEQNETQRKIGPKPPRKKAKVSRADTGRDTGRDTARDNARMSGSDEDGSDDEAPKKTATKPKA